MDYYYGEIGNMTDNGAATNERKHTIIQSLWTKPCTDKTKMPHILAIAALSLAYAHRSGYKVHMHTDSKGYELLKDYGYERLYKTLDEIPETVPKELFAAGKFFAMKAEGLTSVVHTDFDVFLKKPGVIDRFFENKDIDLVCQQEENYDLVCKHDDKIRAMYVLGYPVTTRPNWRGSLNTGVVGFNNKDLAEKYMKNYLDALDMYTAEKFEQYKKTEKNSCLLFDFILEQITLSYMSVGYNIMTIVPTEYATFVADRIGYQHLQGCKKWNSTRLIPLKQKLCEMDGKLYNTMLEAAQTLDLTD